MEIASGDGRPHTVKVTALADRRKPADESVGLNFLGAFTDARLFCVCSGNRLKVLHHPNVVCSGDYFQDGVAPVWGRNDPLILRSAVALQQHSVVTVRLHAQDYWHSTCSSITEVRRVTGVDLRPGNSTRK